MVESGNAERSFNYRKNIVMERTKSKWKNIPELGFSDPIKIKINPSTPIGNILAFDPSMAAFGWVLLDYHRNILNCGCIKTQSEHKKLRIRKGDDTIRRISEINSVLIDLIKSNCVSYIVSELPHGSQSAAAAEMLGIVKGIIQTIADCFEIGIEWYSEGDSKKALFGDGKKTVSKTDTIKAINKIYKVEWPKVKFRREAVADALAVHHVAYIQSSVLKLFGNG